MQTHEKYKIRYSEDEKLHADIIGPKIVKRTVGLQVVKTKNGKVKIIKHTKVV